MLDLLGIYGSHKATSRHNNSGAGKYVLWLIGLVVVGYNIIKAIVYATGFENLYSIIGHILLYGFLFFMGSLLLFGVIFYIRFMIGEVLDFFCYSSIFNRQKDDNKRLRRIN